MVQIRSVPTVVDTHPDVILRRQPIVLTLHADNAMTTVAWRCST
jgi:hypothetical protein